MPPHPVSDADLHLWAAYLRGVQPLPGRAALPAPPSIPVAASPPPAEAAPPPPPRPRGQHTLVTGAKPDGLDRASWNRFAGGRMAPGRTLDLHGKTAQAAFGALQRFLHAAHADGVRCVEIITGRGSGESGGVIRRELPLWLNLPAIRPMILAAAHPHPANPGATRVLLRRVR